MEIEGNAFMHTGSQPVMWVSYKRHGTSHKKPSLYLRILTRKLFVTLFQVGSDRNLSSQGLRPSGFEELGLAAITWQADSTDKAPTVCVASWRGLYQHEQRKKVFRVVGNAWAIDAVRWQVWPCEIVDWFDMRGHATCVFCVLYIHKNYLVVFHRGAQYLSMGSAAY
ncbi:hypothetical protein J6590_013669 [Homalodisca vitripennis]|nr:hypothetical protein J6590_013669 [Homalodisca vitripennis]